MTGGRKPMTALQTTALETLRIALGDYPHTAAIKNRQIRSERVALDFAPITPVYKAFAEMVRRSAYDVSEMAIVTYLQAKSHGKPLVLLPCVMLGRFQHGTLLYNSARGRLALSDLPGRRVGVRSYTQTTGTWLRGHLQNDYGVDPARVHWVNFEDAHVQEYHDPPFVERAGDDKNLLKMVQDGELDAGIFGAELPTDPRLRSVIEDPEAETRRWQARHGVVPLNHMVVVTETLSRARPDLVREVFGMLKQSKQAAGLPRAGEIDFHPFGLDACRPALEMIIQYAVQQKLIPRPFEVDALFDETTRALR
jgi:4,5-dihydroxyphthalate decarboxylase